LGAAIYGSKDDDNEEEELLTVLKVLGHKNGVKNVPTDGVEHR